MSADRISSPRTFYKLIFFSAIFIILVARVVIAWRSPRHRRVLPAPVAEDVAALRRARRAADRRAAEAEAALKAAEDQFAKANESLATARNRQQQSQHQPQPRTQ